WGAAVVEIEMNSLSLETLVRGVWLCLDGGKAVDNAFIRRTVETGILNTLNWISLSCAEPLKGNPDSAFIPPVTIEIINSGKKMQPGGVGELPMNLIPAAYITAASQAAGCYLDSLPLYPELIFQYAEEE
ncbi:MAG: hypothetical protein AB1798_17690, partial [Spirochaetota bacterium]